LHTAITESRKSKNPLVLGFQGKAQLEDIYGRLAEVMLSQPATKIFMRTGEPKAAEWISESIGKVEIERLRETKFDGSRAGKNFTVDRQVEPLVMPSEIAGLEDRHAYLKLGNNVARFVFDFLDSPGETEEFVARKSEDDELAFDRRTLAPRRPGSPSVVPADDSAPAPSSAGTGRAQQIDGRAIALPVHQPKSGAEKSSTVAERTPAITENRVAPDIEQSEEMPPRQHEKRDHEIGLELNHS
jgi:hypothetical protein